jgi:fructokinase
MKQIVGLGEVLWDVFPDKKLPGGSPANVAYHANTLEDKGLIVSSVGEDALGNELVDWLSSKHLDTQFIQRDPTHPTGTVDIVFDDGEPTYHITENVAWDFIAYNASMEALASKVDAACFASLAQRSDVTAQSIQAFVRAMRPDALRVFDVNLRPPYYAAETLFNLLKLADVVKVNQAEWEEIGRLLGIEDVSTWLIETVGVSFLCLTYGKNGAELRTREGAFFQKADIVDISQGDVVGVGDAFLAAVTTQLLKQKHPNEALAFANRYAGYVATQKGGMPEIPTRFRTE